MTNGSRKQFTIFASLVFLISCQSVSPPIMGNQSFETYSKAQLAGMLKLQ